MNYHTWSLLKLCMLSAVNSRCLIGLFFRVAWFVNCNRCGCAVLVDSGVDVTL